MPCRLKLVGSRRSIVWRPDETGLLDGQAEQLAHPGPAFDIRERFERDQYLSPLSGGSHRDSSGANISSMRAVTRSRARRMRAFSSGELPWFAISDAPQRQPASRRSGRVSRRAPRCASCGRRRRPRGGASADIWAMRIVDGRDLQGADVGKALEDRAHGIARAFGDLGRGRHSRRHAPAPARDRLR